MKRVALLVCLLACKKDSGNAGMAPASDWQQSPNAGQSAPAQPQPPPQQPPVANPHEGGPPPNPHGGGMGGGGGGPMMAQHAPTTLEKQADGRLVMGPFTLVPPKDWKEIPVTSSVRAAQFTISDKKDEQADLVVTFFGPNGVGPVDANIDRWVGQVQQANGKPSKDIAKIEQVKIAGQDATLVSVSGHVMTQQMGPSSPPAVDITDGGLIGAIVTSPSGPYYFKITGYKKTLDAAAPKFRAMLTGMKLK
jgi:hypothetical protein